MVFFDPGPLVASIPAAAADQVLDRADWLTCNGREAAALTGRPDPAAALSALVARAQQRRPAWRGGPARPGQPGRPLGVLVRTGKDGCLLGRAGADPLRVPGFAVDAIDTSGAGDAHTGTFIAALAHGSSEAGAARTANAAAALSVTRRGPATAPTAAELSRFLAARDITRAG